MPFEQVSESALKVQELGYRFLLFRLHSYLIFAVFVFIEWPDAGLDRKFGDFDRLLWNVCPAEPARRVDIEERRAVGVQCFSNFGHQVVPVADRGLSCVSRFMCDYDLGQVLPDLYFAGDLGTGR